MSFMRGVVENAIRNMSPDERMSALQAVTEQVVGQLTVDERIAALQHIVAQLAQGIPDDRVEELLERLR